MYSTNNVLSLTRGARYYDKDVLDENLEFAQAVLDYFEDEKPNFIRNRTLTTSIISAGVNLRDQIRKDQVIPLQFLYEAADCRIFYTPQTVYNYTALWQYAADAIWNDSGKCVTGSMGYSSVNGTKAAAPAQDVLPPASTGPPPKLGAAIHAMISGDDLKPEPVTSTTDKSGDPDGAPCGSKDPECEDDYFCAVDHMKCDKQKKKMVKSPICVLRCSTNSSDECDDRTNCRPLPPSVPPSKDEYLQEKSFRGYCKPSNKTCKKKPAKPISQAGFEKTSPPPKV